MARYETGHPGGPGRPAGRLNDATLKLQALMIEALQPAMKTLNEALADGDRMAARVVVEWIGKHCTTLNIELPDIKSLDDVFRSQAIIARAMAAGEVSPAHAQLMIGALDKVRVTYEAVVVEGRLDKVEKQQAKESRLKRALAKIEPR